jgi:hypothetical protein
MSSRPAAGQWAMSIYPEVGVEHRHEQLYIGTTRSVTMGNFAPVADRIPEMIAWLGRQGVAPAGVPFFRYHVIDMERELVIEAGVPLPRRVTPTEDLTVEVLPAGRYVTTTYTGPPEELVAVTSHLLSWAQGRGLTFDERPSAEGDVWGCRLELLETNPAEVPNPSDWVTTLAFRLTD